VTAVLVTAMVVVMVVMEIVMAMQVMYPGMSVRVVGEGEAVPAHPGRHRPVGQQRYDGTRAASTCSAHTYATCTDVILRSCPASTVTSALPHGQRAIGPSGSKS
jgi:hypothetical protein